MKKIQKFLITVGIIGGIDLIVKWFNEHYEIKRKEKCKNKIKDNSVTFMTTIDPEAFKLKYHGELADPDHVYYDNPYNICKIHFDRNGCPSVFEFSNKNDRNIALMDFTRDYLQINSNRGYKYSLKDIFDFLGLIIDDYPEFEQHFVCWTSKDFVEANEENALETILDFGEFEVHPV